MACAYMYPHLCTHMSINDIPDRDGHVHTYVRTYIMRIDPSFRASRHVRIYMYTYMCYYFSALGEKLCIYIQCRSTTPNHISAYMHIVRSVHKLYIINTKLTTQPLKQYTYVYVHKYSYNTCRCRYMLCKNDSYIWTCASVLCVNDKGTCITWRKFGYNVHVQ